MYQNYKKKINYKKTNLRRFEPQTTELTDQQPNHLRHSHILSPVTKNFRKKFKLPLIVNFIFN